MNERDLDRIIDTAAEQMMSHEPSSTFTRAVMARARDEAPDSRRRPFLWVTAGAAATVCTLFLVFTMNKPSVPVLHAPVPTDPPAARVEQRPLPVAPSGGSERSPETAQTLRREPRTATPVFVPPGDPTALVEPITIEPVSASAIELPQIEIETSSTSIDFVQIEPVVVEPISASND